MVHCHLLSVLPLLTLIFFLPVKASAEFEILQQEIVDGVEEAYVRYPSLDGISVTGWLFVHTQSGADREPAILFNHGGVGGVSGGTRGICRKIAKAGYVVFAPSYRGEDDSEGEIEVAMGEVDDVLAALLLLQDHPGIVPGQFALVGTSHGALVSVKALARPEGRELIRAVVSAYGVMDIHAWWEYLIENDFDVSDDLSRRIYGEGPADKPEAFIARDALRLIDQLSPAPIFLVQGELDRIVPPAQARTFAAALRGALRVQDSLRIYVVGGHGLLYWDDPERHSPEALADAEQAWRDIFGFLGNQLHRDANTAAQGH